MSGRAGYQAQRPLILSRRRVLAALLVAAQLPLLVGMAGPNDGAEVAPRPNNIVGLNLARLHQSQYIWAASEVANANGGAWGYITILLTNQDRDSSAPAHLLQ